MYNKFKQSIILLFNQSFIKLLTIIISLIIKILTIKQIDYPKFIFMQKHTGIFGKINIDFNFNSIQI